MHYKHGLFFPDNFPWSCDHALAILHKTAVVNGVCGRVLLRTLPLTRAWWTKKGRETHIEKVLKELFGSSASFCWPSHDVKFVADGFPRIVFGPVKYCAACLAETGFVPTVFSLRVVIRCPWHHQPLKPLCGRCQDIWQFTPTPFGSPVGYRCEDCGYWVPSRGAIFASCRADATLPFRCACFHFVENTQRLQRLGVLDVLNFAKLTDCPTQGLADGGEIPEFVRDDTTTYWYKRLDLSGPSAASGSPDEDYRRFVRFHQEHLLKAHRDCPCGAALSQPDCGDSSRSVCVYTVALSLFRQKFEYLSCADAVPRLSEQASQQLAALRMAPRVARRFFQFVFYRLIARLWFWSRTAARFVVHIDPRHFGAGLEVGSLSMLHLLLWKEWPGNYSYELDLPADRAAMRQLMGPVQAEQVLRISNFGTRAELSAPVTPRLFYGGLRATAMFYF